MSKNDSQYFIYGCTLAWSLSARSSFIMKYNTDVRCTRDAVAQIGQSFFEVVFEIRFSTDFRRFFFSKYISCEICVWQKYYLWPFQKEFGYILAKCSKQASSCSRDNFKRNTNEITLSTEEHCNALQGARYSSDHIRTNIICELCFIIGFRIACCGNSIKLQLLMYSKVSIIRPGRSRLLEFEKR